MIASNFMADRWTFDPPEPPVDTTTGTELEFEITVFPEDTFREFGQVAINTAKAFAALGATLTTGIVDAFDAFAEFERFGGWASKQAILQREREANRQAFRRPPRKVGRGRAPEGRTASRERIRKRSRRGRRS